MISNFVAPYNLVDTNVLEEPTIPVSGEKTTTKIVEGVEILVSFYSTGFQFTVQNMKISITKFFPAFCYFIAVRFKYYTGVRSLSYLEVKIGGRNSTISIR